MRNSLAVLVLSLGAVAGAAALLSAQQPRPGMSEGRFWINNRTRDEAIPVTLANVDSRAPAVPVAVHGTVTVSVNGLTPVTASRQPWEYRSVEVTGDQDPARALNVFGNDGWEAVGVTLQQGAKTTIVLKRPR